MTAEQDKFEADAIDYLDVATLNALFREGLDDYPSLKNTTIDVLADVRGMGMTRLTELVAMMKVKGHSDTPWVKEYDRRIAEDIKIFRYERRGSRR